MKLADIAHLLPKESMDLMRRADVAGQLFSEVFGDSVTDLGWDNVEKQAELCVNLTNGRRLEVIVRELKPITER